MVVGDVSDVIAGKPRSGRRREQRGGAAIDHPREQAGIHELQVGNHVLVIMVEVDDGGDGRKLRPWLTHVFCSDSVAWWRIRTGFLVEEDAGVRIHYGSSLLGALLSYGSSLLGAVLIRLSERCVIFIL